MSRYIVNRAFVYRGVYYTRANAHLIDDLPADVIQEKLDREVISLHPDEELHVIVDLEEDPWDVVSEGEEEDEALVEEPETE